MDENAAEFVGEIPHFYDTGLGPVIFSHYATVMGARAAALAPHDVLETAAGTGIVSAELREQLPEAALVITDLNGPMLEIARSRLDGTALVETADAQSLQYADESFDVVVCQFGLMFLPDLKAGFREAARVLRPGGTFLFSVWDSHAHNPFAALADGVLSATFAEKPPPFYRVPFSMSAVDPLRELAQAAGFGAITIEVLPHATPVASWEDFAAGLVRGNPVVDQIRARGADPLDVEATVRSLLEQEFGPVPTTMPIQTVLYAATLA
ncbi:class I SAM-dependent methyltransferase [Nocardioides cavernaquae]|uniref:Class I SAM-dependent methyltransferase n=1 Tax=Nocardioides cavernaquae TaxID=2321396 RepID=A0A3A5HBU5_9ACTN|nr:class I SAM-dependent methyltransferase [Nocardioides cavernaquae]RJS47591.1 class I SAM-dependent methyltransferase [Nocardioides cavernaquae]